MTVVQWRGEALPFLRGLLDLEEAGSTNDLAKEWANAWPSHRLPTLIRAERQTAGRGRGSNAWWSDSGSLTFSIVLEPAAHGIQREHEPRMALAAGLAVLHAARPWLSGSHLGIRWPNDVEVAGRKLAGILVERTQGELGARMVIGIGVNVSTRFTEATAPDVQRLGTSLADHDGWFESGDRRPQVLAGILESFERQLARLAAEDPEFYDDLNRHDLLRGCAVRIDQGAGVLVGTGRGIGPDGALLLEVDGAIRPIHGGRVLREGS